jgi:ABC-type transport system involved in multi-copper enzyme maturation permease subunit
VQLRSVFDIANHLVRDTFRQANASGISAIMSAITAVCVLLCLSVEISGDATLYAPDEPALFLPASPHDQPPAGSSATKTSRPAYETDPVLARREGIETVSGQMSLAFGAISISLGRDRRDAVQFLQLVLGGAVAGIFGLLLTLVWTAGFVPSFLEPSAASVLLTKPIPRWQLLVGKYLGVFAFVAVQVLLFIVLTWLALGARTHVWDLAYWWCAPLLLLQFAIFYSFSILVAVVTRSTPACVFGSLLFWLLAWAVNYASVMVHVIRGPQFVSTAGRSLVGFAYWIMPKPIDLGLILFNLLDARAHFAKPVVFEQLEATHTLVPALSCLSSLLIIAAFLALSVHELNHADY